MIDLPLGVAGFGTVLLLCGFAVGGLALVRRRVLPRLVHGEGDAEFSGAMVHSVMVFYGLALALISVDVWQRYGHAEGIVSNEATALAMLYRDAGGYPEPTRSQLQGEIRGYTEHVIREAWPLQRKGEVPSGGVALMNQLQTALFTFQPSTESQGLLHGEALNAYNRLIEARRLRLDAVETHLPGVMWTVIVLGALISVSTSFFFRVKDPRLHVTLVLFLASFIGLVIFLTMVLDRPFQGHLALSPRPYQLVYDQLMSH